MFEGYPDVMNTEQLCSALGLCYPVVVRLLNDGSIRCFRVNRTYRIPKRFVIDFIEKGCSLANGNAG